MIDPATCSMVASGWFSDLAVFTVLGAFVGGVEPVAVSELVIGDLGDYLRNIWNVRLPN